MERTKQDIRKELLSNLAISTGINIQDEGSIAVAIVDSVLDEIYGLHQELAFMKEQAYLSTSQGHYTELIAQLLNEERDSFESDDDLKHKVTLSVHKQAKANQIAVEETVRAVPGVAEAMYRPFGAGTGSFVVYVYPQPQANQLRLLDAVEEALQGVVADGIYFEVRAPKDNPVDIHMLVEFKAGVPAMERQSIRAMVERNIRGYVNGLAINEVLYVNELIRLALNTHEQINDVSIVNLTVGGVARQVINTFPTYEERFVSGDIQII